MFAYFLSIVVIMGYFLLQVLYAVREYACTAIDIIARRTRLAFCNVHAAEEALPRVIQIMAQELKWSKQQQEVKQSTVESR